MLIAKSTVKNRKKSNTADTNLQQIPGVGESIEQDLHRLGIMRVSQLRGQNPQALYDELRKQFGGTLDRCMLYVFRCAVYYAQTPMPEPEKLKWWYWKNERINEFAD